MNIYVEEGLTDCLRCRETVDVEINATIVDWHVPNAYVNERSTAEWETRRGILCGACSLEAAEFFDPTLVQDLAWTSKKDQALAALKEPPTCG